MPQTAIRKLCGGESLNREDALKTIHGLMDGKYTPSQIGAILIALHIKGETVEEVTGFAMGMHERLIPVHAKRTPLLDTCGTGGSSFRVFNVSTCSAFVAAAAGIGVAKHGNRAVTGVCGSADVLEALGIQVDITPEQCADCIDSVGIGFIFAQRHHPALAHVGPSRREIGVRTIFNLLGPLSNPAGAKMHALGVYEPSLCSLAAKVLRELGSTSAVVMHGDIGLDEISIVGETQISELRNGEVEDYTLHAADFGVDESSMDLNALAPASTTAENAALVREALSGVDIDAGGRSRRTLVAVNAAAALRTAGLAESWKEAVDLANTTISERRALDKLNELTEFTRSFIR